MWILYLSTKVSQLFNCAKTWQSGEELTAQKSCHSSWGWGMPPRCALGTSKLDKEHIDWGYVSNFAITWYGNYIQLI